MVNKFLLLLANSNLFVYGVFKIIEHSVLSVVTGISVEFVFLYVLFWVIFTKKLRWFVI
jgi:hypothetical protein